MKTKRLAKIKSYCRNILFVSVSVLCSMQYLNAQSYLKGDFHQHTTYTDGSWSIQHMMSKNNQYGLDWWANSEHGGGFTKNGAVSGTDKGTTIYWDSYTTNPIIGKAQSSGGHQVMWRWQMLRDSSFKQIQMARLLYPSKVILQSYEWNVPGHEHGSVGLISNQFSATPNCNPLAEFEYKFDNSDGDDIGGVAQGWVKSILSGHAKTLEAITWLNTNYSLTSYVVPAHPERQKLYKINHFRDMNNAGPTVCFGFESMPGHQKDAGRGGYSASADGGGTFGGCGYYAARVGGLWDAMLSEGRAFWLFASSDYHDVAGDFYPGEYQKTYTYSKTKTAQGAIDGLRSGNNWVVEGDLIDSLVFTIDTLGHNDTKFASMGSTMFINKNNSIRITVKVRDPQGVNNNTYSAYNSPSLSRIDIIKGKVGSKINSTDPKYSIDSVSTTSVIGRFDAVGNVSDSKGIISTKWSNLGNGWLEMSFIVPVSDSSYYRLRGSNLGLSVANETDGAGNPLADGVVGANNATKAFADLWFYSNPIFVYPTKNQAEKTLTVRITNPDDDLEEYIPAGSGQSLTKVVGDVDAGSSDIELGSVTTGTEDPQLVGLRFPNIAIPKNAFITSAKIEFEVDQNDKNASPCNLQIYAENNDNPATFTYVPFVLTSRPKINDSVSWTIDAGEGEVIDSKCYTSDLKTLVQKLVTRAGWASGNAMAFYIKGSGTREMESHNGEPDAAAAIKITYTLPEVGKATKIQIKSASDDVEEWLAPKAGQTQAKTIGLIDSTSSDLEIGCETSLNADPQMIGLRFPNITLPKNYVITKAFIEFEVDATNKNADPSNLFIWSENNDNPATFNYKLFSLTNRPKSSDSIGWSIPAGSFNVVDQKYQTVDIQSLVQSKINRAGWKSGNAMAFFIKGTGVREVETYDGEAAAAASLVIEYSDVMNHLDTVLMNAYSLVDSNYTTPSWTSFLKAFSAAKDKRDSATVSALELVITKMQGKQYPYSIGMSINGTPTTNMAFNWFTNVGITGGKVEIVAGTVTNHTAFATPAFSIVANCDSVKNLNYSVSANALSAAGIPVNGKKSYMQNKALATGLAANTTYSFRVGKTGAWSEIGTFKTAKANKDEFSFVYFTDPQANTDAMFDISQKTTHVAQSMYPNANFWLSCGDLVETSGSTNSEWEYEQFFATQQDILMKNPFVPVTGNHDKSANKNFTYHFNTANPNFEKTMATTPGSVYSFVYGDALFMAFSYEDYSVVGYLDSLAVWMNKQVKANPTAKWRIAYYHKTMYTGSGSHQSDADGKTCRDKMTPVFDSLKIDWALQGHDHVYEVIGPLKNKALVAGAVSNQTIVAPTVRDNVTGLLGGTFDVKEGTLYFLNNSGGKKKYEPRTQAQMVTAEVSLGLTNYFSFFTGRFGQTGEPTFSYITLSTDSIIVKTYTVNDLGVASLFDNYKIIKSTPVGLKEIDNKDQSNSINVWPNPAEDALNVVSTSDISSINILDMTGKLMNTTIVNNTNAYLNISNLKTGMYLVKVSNKSETKTIKIIKK